MAAKKFTQEQMEEVREALLKLDQKIKAGNYTPNNIVLDKKAPKSEEKTDEDTVL